MGVGVLLVCMQDHERILRQVYHRRHGIAFMQRFHYMRLVRIACMAAHIGRKGSRRRAVFQYDDGFAVLGDICTQR